MIVQCDQCATKYTVPDEKVPAAGIKAQCKGCGHIMLVSRPAPELTLDEPAVEPDRPELEEFEPSGEEARSSSSIPWRGLLLVGAFAVVVGVGASYVLGQVLSRSLATFLAAIFK